MTSASSASSAKSRSQLQMVRGIAQGRERKLARELSELMRQRASAVATVERLQDYLNEYRNEESERGARPMSEVENERRFVNRLNLALQQQCTHAQRLDESTTAKLRLWQREHANLQALDRLLSQRAHAQTRLQERHDQKQSDALSLRAINKGIPR